MWKILAKSRPTRYERTRIVAHVAVQQARNVDEEVVSATIVSGAIGQNVQLTGVSRSRE
jgi:hypothetical protein